MTARIPEPLTSPTDDLAPCPEPCGREWSVTNHTFIGKVLVHREVAGVHRLSRKEDAWIDFAVDLRVINEIKVSGFRDDDPHHTDLRHNGVFVATVNCPFHELLPHFLSCRHLFDLRPPDQEVPVLPERNIAGFPNWDGRIPETKC